MMDDNTSEEQMEDSMDYESGPEAPKKRTGLIVGLVLLVVLLAGAAFIGGQMLGRQQEKNQAGQLEGPEYVTAKELPEQEPELAGMVARIENDNLIVQEFVMGDAMSVGGGAVVVSGGVMGSAVGGGEGVVVVESGPAGVAESVESITIEGGEAPEVVEFFVGGEMGPEIEVVVSSETRIYKDTTMLTQEPIMMVVESGGNGIPPEMPEMPELPEKIEQTVEPGTMAEIGPNSFVTIWGERRGDRVYATVLLYQAPMTFNIEDQP